MPAASLRPVTPGLVTETFHLSKALHSGVSGSKTGHGCPLGVCLPKGVHLVALEELINWRLREYLLEDLCPLAACSQEGHWQKVGHSVGDPELQSCVSFLSSPSC